MDNLSTLSKILEKYVITHIRKTIVRKKTNYLIAVVPAELFEKGESGVDYLPKVFEGSTIQEVMDAVGCI